MARRKNKKVVNKRASHAAFIPRDVLFHHSKHAVFQNIPRINVTKQEG